VFVTTDVHFATGFCHAPFPDLSFPEFVSGPLHAGLFPKLESLSRATAAERGTCNTRKRRGR
jgi:hypothetical protein